MIIDFTHIRITFLTLCWVLVAQPLSLQATCTTPTGLNLNEAGHTYATVSWNNNSNAIYYGLRFKPSAGVSWVETTIVGSTSATIYLLPCTNYDIQVKSFCSDGEESSYGSSINVLTNGCSEVYCLSYGLNTNFEWIQSVGIGDFTNNSDNNFGYGQFLSTPVALETGETYSFTASPGYATDSFAEYWRVWIDFNQDNTFNNTNELIYSSPFANTLAVNTNISIPSDALVGTTRMRVSMKWVGEENTLPSACEAFDYGEVEDYLVSISQPVVDCSALYIDVDVTPATCGNSNGSIFALPLGGQNPYDFEWNTGETSLFINNLSSGNYTISITDNNNCSIIQTITVPNTTSPSLSLNSFSAANCGLSDGFVSVNTIGGATPYLYTWSHDSGLNSPTASNLAGGNYTVTVFDANACSDIFNIDLPNNDGVSISDVVSNPPDCSNNNGSISIFTGGSTGTLNYTWSHNASLNSATASNLSAGNYQFTVTDANNCEATGNINLAIENNASLSVSSTNNELCNQGNGSIVVTADGTAPFSYTWSHNSSLGTAFAFGLSSGFYTITVTDANNCTASTLALVSNEGSPPMVSSSDVIPASCGESNGLINIAGVDGVGPFTYIWSHDSSLNSSLATNLSAGLITVTITDSNNCSNTFTANVSSEDAIDATINVSNATCGLANGSASLDLEGGTPPFTINWSASSNTESNIDNLLAGTYTVTITDSNDCILVESFTVENESSLSNVDFLLQDENCGAQNGWIWITDVDGAVPIAYNWSNGISNAYNGDLIAGTYTVTITDSNDCTLVESYTVNSIGGLAIDIESFSPSCGLNNGVINIIHNEGTPPYNYTWSNGAPNVGSITNLSPDTYFVTITDGNACSLVETVNLEDTGNVVAGIIATNNASCGLDNGSITLAAQGGSPPYTYSAPFNNEGFAENLAAATYTVTVSDVNNCTDEINITLQAVPSPTIEFTVQETSCNNADGAAAATIWGGTAPFDYMWSNGDTDATINSVAGDTYTLTVSDINDCSASATVNIPQLQDPILSLPDTVELTAGGTVTLDASPINGLPATYFWNIGVNTSTINVSVADTYLVQVTQNGCVTIQEVEVVLSTSLQNVSTPQATSPLTVYPNPVKDVLQVYTPTVSASSHTNWYISNIAGQLVKGGTLQGAQTRIDIADLPMGIYFFSAAAQTVKLVVQR